MKNIIKSIVIAIMIAVCFTSCTKEDYYPNYITHHTYVIHNDQEDPDIPDIPENQYPEWLLETYCFTNYDNNPSYNNSSTYYSLYENLELDTIIDVKYSNEKYENVFIIRIFTNNDNKKEALIRWKFKPFKYDIVYSRLDPNDYMWITLYYENLDLLLTDLEKITFNKNSYSFVSSDAIKFHYVINNNVYPGLNDIYIYYDYDNGLGTTWHGTSLEYDDYSRRIHKEDVLDLINTLEKSK